MFDGSYEDIEFKKICLLIIHNIAIHGGKDEEFIQIINKNGFIDTLLCFLDIENNSWLVQKYSDENLKDMQLFIINLLINFINNMPTAFTESKIG